MTTKVPLALEETTIPLEELLKDESFLGEFESFKESMQDVDRDMLIFVLFRSIAESTALHTEESTVFEENFEQAFDMLNALEKEVAILKKKIKALENIKK